MQPYIHGMQVFAILLLLCRPCVVNAELIKYVVVALPGLAAGTFVGVALFGKINEQKFRYAVLSLVLISGCFMAASIFSKTGPRSMTAQKSELLTHAEAR